MMFNNVDSIYTFAFASERKENCLACSRCSHDLAFLESDKLQVFLDKIGEETEFNLQKPTLTTISSSGENRTLYMSNLASMEEALRPNLEKTFKELEFESGQEVVVTDPGVKMPVHFKLHLT